MIKHAAGEKFKKTVKKITTEVEISKSALDVSDAQA